VALKEIPVWEVPEHVRASFLYGHYVSRAKEKLPNVKYPALKSYTPLYGDARFRSMGGTTGRPEHFYFALDRSEMGGAYDLLYFDDNADADLTNDTLRRPLAKPPEGLIRRSSRIREETYFELVKVPFDFGPGGSRWLELLPRLHTFEDGKSAFGFIPLHVHTGEFDVGGRSYQVFRGYPNVIGGRLDEPTALLIVLPRGGGEPAEWFGGTYLNATHLLGTRYCRFSSTPTGDRLFVQPYDGPLGIFEVDAGGRNVKRLEIKGSLSAEETTVAVGYTLENGRSSNTRRYEIPIGDYHPAAMEASVGSVRFTVSSDYPRDTQGRPIPGGAPACRIAIREEKPYVLAFSNTPRVVFLQPQENLRACPGDEVKTETALLDPGPGILIPYLYDIVSGETVTYRTPEGRERTVERVRPLEPKVLIKRADGGIVAQGGMAFG
jgi:hypothetical protein